MATNKNFSFSILIPTWNNLAYLQLCIESLRRHSVGDHQVIVHVNEGTDGTLDWLAKEDIEHTHTPNNIGICEAMNHAFTLVEKEYVVYLNDDMYVLPDWDQHLWEEVEKIEDKAFMLSGTMIEPADTGNPAVIVANFGKDMDSFQEEELLAAKLGKTDWSGASWPPVLIPRQAWEAVGGFSEEFSPGFYSDPDLSMKLWQKGCRIFKGVGKSQVYHFQQKSTGKVKKNDGRKQFMQKWGITASAFYKYYLKMGESYTGRLNDPPASLGLTISKWKSRLSG